MLFFSYTFYIQYFFEVDECTRKTVRFFLLVHLYSNSFSIEAAAPIMHEDLSNTELKKAEEKIEKVTLISCVSISMYKMYFLADKRI